MTKVKQKKELITLFVTIGIITIFIFFYPIIQPRIYSALYNNFSIISNRGNLLVHFITVGQGDAIAINLPDGKVMLIDAGPTDSNVSLTTYINEKVVNSKLNKRIDYFVMTHADSDHIGGALRLLQTFEVDTIYMPVVTEETATYSELYDYIYENDYNLINSVDAEDIIKSNYTIEFFGPIDTVDENDFCQIIRIEYISHSFIFTGDISSEIENEYVKTYGELLDSDVLKVAHHGSKYSSSIEFVEAVSPKYAVISCGPNSYGHPTQEAISSISSTGATILRTDNDGNILFAVGDYYDLSVKTGEYGITGVILDYRILILVIDGVLIFCAVKRLLQEKRSKKRKYQ